jgi:hypothetical protein
MSSSYKRLLNEVHKDKVVTQATIDKCLENQAFSKIEDDAAEAAEMAEEKEMSMEEKLARVEKRERKLATKTGLSYEEWLTQAKKFYVIEPFGAGFDVLSVARSPNTPPERWYCSDMYDARVKVLQLIRYKLYDHAVRGRDFAYIKD